MAKPLLNKAISSVENQALAKGGIVSGALISLMGDGVMDSGFVVPLNKIVDILQNAQGGTNGRKTIC